MNGKKRRGAASSLYLILDKEACRGRRLEDVLRRALEGGVDLVQLRDKVSSSAEMIRQARSLLAITRPRGIALIINDRLDVALAAKADGLHVGQDDMPAALARKLLGAGPLLGLSCHSTDQVRRAQAQDVDYLGFGPVFATPTKPGRRGRGAAALRRALRLSRKPLFAIGGITRETLPALRGLPRLRIAVVRAVCRAQDPCRAAQLMKKELDTNDVSSPLVTRNRHHVSGRAKTNAP
ncbi:MAG: thiamine phosphate synthase [Deltaproteobacteria bacterium]